MNTIIPISDLRRKFGEIEALLPYVENFTITKKGRPFATLTATDDIKKSIIKKYAGAFKNTDLDNDSIWGEVLKKKSRKKQIKI
ncbi:MAG: hypothetical protein US48_C0020G0009 [Candidatus Levybacteria bacterium GW2011_GWA2_37_36]|uniref:Antitoxin n=1 Tax=Candidatus Roizmanbacteria bacterium GW2011_GWC2_34_23 TaxID=1618484 RepID=A0A0G0E214_9BACT|nr:MAG: hypothetical protein UR56_C0013G0032 [Candidatus Roizmanbacteria bacterium GW2011_GWC2_34_23]KKQ32894.1 MAG: hypothetical protein US48_C0020G0009 [Candidatus Levybacteria bacterium GW2011_GWA2_37_36]